ncbi:MAG: family 20 glycosylhydrolase [Prevotella sp.]|nr:family 20 glycosylhydrolase [Prevotella sp.]
MRKILLMAAIWIAALSYAQPNEKPFTIPEVTEWKGDAGTTQLSGRIVVKSASLRPVAEALVRDYALLNGSPLTLASGKARSGDIVLVAKKLDTMPAEGYRLQIGDMISIEAPAAQGAFWATRTLLQLVEQNAQLPRGEIVDVPQYRLRGFMLDVGRKYIPMSYLRELVKVMAYYKMNTLQLHLNDNGFKKYYDDDWSKTQAAFRLECETYPGLTARDGSYTKAEFIELQQLAEAYHVEIIPEIDAPAHVLAFTHYRPSLGSKEYGMDHFDLSNPEVYPFMDNLFKEYLSGKEPVFRGPRVNIGTDEYSNANQTVVEQFRQFTDHYLALVESYGKKPALWGSLTHAKGTTPVRHEGVLMNCWSNGFARPDSMKQLGYQILSIPDGLVYIVPAAGYYYDYLNCGNLYNNWTPAVIGNQTFEEQDPQIEGGMFAVWNDHPGNGITVKDIHHRLFPAMQTISTKCWTGQKTSLPYASFDAKRLTLSEAPGVNQLDRLPETAITLDNVEADAPLQLQESSVMEAGYNYRVSFDIDCAAETPGTILTQSPNAIFYLSDPVHHRLGFARDGYLCTFNYALPSQGHVSIAIEGTNTETRLFVNGQHRQTLATQDVVAVTPQSQVTYPTETPFMPTVYTNPARMKYVQTLVFPLQETGRFNSRVTNLRVEKLK